MKKFIRNIADKVCFIGLLAAAGCAENDDGGTWDYTKEVDKPVTGTFNLKVRAYLD